MPVSEIGSTLLQPYYRVDERGYFQFGKLLETGEVVFGLPAAAVAAIPLSHLFTEIGTLVMGQAALVDETGQVSINVTPNPMFNFLTETGMHVIAPYQPFVDYFRPVQAQPANQTDSAPGTGWEIVLYPEDNDESDTFTVLIQ